MINEGWVKVKYKEVVDKISTSKQKIKQREYLPQGKYPVIDQGQPLIGGYTNDVQKLVTTDLPVIVFGDHTKIVKLIEFQFVSGADGTKILRPKKFISPKYLAYLTQMLVFKIKDKGYSRHYQYIEILPVPLAPSVEQRAVVAKLDKLFSELDNGIANLKAVKRKLEIYRQSVLKMAFEGKLLPPEKLEECRKETDYEPAGDLLKKMSPKAMPSKSKIKEDWVEVEYREVVNKVSTSKRKIKQREYLSQGKYPVIDQGQPLIGGYTNDVQKLVTTDLPVIVFGDHTKIVKLIEFQFVSGADGTKILRPKKFISPKYLAYLTQMLVFKIKDKGYSRHYQYIEILPVPLAPFVEQRAIVSAIESRLSACDKLSRDIDENLGKSQSMRQSILKKAFDGELLSETELRACRKQTDWAPAEKLLEGIKESKPLKPTKSKK